MAGIDFSAMMPIIMILIVVWAVAVIVGTFIKPFSPFLRFLLGRRKPLDQNREDYHAMFMHDLKRGAKRNKVPAKYLYVKDPKDPDHPWIYYGKILGINAETDVAHILLKFKSISPFSQLLFIPKNYLTDLNSRDLYAKCAGFRPVAKHFWLPIWGSRIDQKQREKLREVVRTHIDALFMEALEMFTWEETSAQTVAGMEPKLKSGREPISRETKPMAVEQPEGEEVIE